LLPLSDSESKEQSIEDKEAARKKAEADADALAAGLQAVFTDRNLELAAEQEAHRKSKAEALGIRFFLFSRVLLSFLSFVFVDAKEKYQYLNIK
jgi:hypothetical protein